MKPKNSPFFERFKSPEDWLWDLLCTRQARTCNPMIRSHIVEMIGHELI
jgi:hypothetical protein